jgi:hypothetical protein
VPPRPRRRRPRNRSSWRSSREPGAALEGFEVRAYDDAEIERLAACGLTPDSDPAVILDGPHIEICFQTTDPPPVAKTPTHLDLRSDDRATEVQRLVALGACVKRQFETHTWMQEPEQRLLRR